MTAGWKRATRAEPCPICKKPDWCSTGQFWIHCMRVTSPKQTARGGWLHPLNGAPQAVPVRPSEPKPTVDVGALHARWLKRMEPQRLQQLERLLGIPEQAFLALNVAFAEEHEAWAFPMVNADLEVTGVRLRNERGEKWAVRGGRNGLFVPKNTPGRRCYICEGPTDTAALLSIGLFAIGRPSCNEGAAILAPLLTKMRVREAIVVGDHDNDKSRPDGTSYNPGIDGALRLRDTLPVPNCVWIPPTKDAREFVTKGGSLAQVETLVKGAKWTQPAVTLP